MRPNRIQEIRSRHLRPILLFFLVALHPLAGTGQTVWFKYEGNPVLDVGPKGSWDAGCVLFPMVVPLRDTLRMWYTGESPDNVDRIGYAWSTDGGITWTRHASNPVLSPTLPWENGWTYGPYVIYTDPMFRMWYTGNNGTGPIGYATSYDGIVWLKTLDHPVLTGSPSQWDERWMAGKTIIGPDSTGKLKMWYEACDRSGNRAQIGYATAPNETTWTKATDVNPVLQPGPKGTWESQTIRSPQVVWDGREYHVWYGGGYKIIGVDQIGHATSYDGIAWMKDSANPVLRPTRGSWDSAAITNTAVLLEGDIYHAWYVGYDGLHLRIGYAVSPRDISYTVSHRNAYDLPGVEPVWFFVRTKQRSSLSFVAIIETPPDATAGGPAAARRIVNTLKLYDDGTHSDQLKGDGLFANLWMPPEENIFHVSLEMKMNGRKTQPQFIRKDVSVFTTVGPLSLDGFEILDNKKPTPGDSIHVRLVLRNRGRTRTATSISTALTVGDSIVVPSGAAQPYADIPPARTSVTSGYHTLWISPDAPTASDVTVKVAIASLGEPFWYDTFVLHTVPPWWKTQWATILYFVLFALVIFSVYRFRVSRLRLEGELKMQSFEAEKFRELDETKSRFFANISHEFRTPLTLILGPVHKWQERANREDEKKELSMAERNAHNLLGLINQLLDLSKLDAGKMRLRARRMNIVPLIKGVTYSFESSAGIRGLTLKALIDRDVIAVYCDKEVIEKVLMNLLSNAFKFTPAGGTVEIRVDLILLAPSSLKRRKGGWREKISRSFLHEEGEAKDLRASADFQGRKGREVVRLTVADTGIGIAPEEVSKVFDRFYQVDDSTTRDQQGTGIGLALVKELVELHHGSISVTSRPGVGTTFTVSLPAGKDDYRPEEIVEGYEDEKITEELSPETTHEGTDPREGSGAMKDRKIGNKLILIVEDNADVREYIKDNLPGCLDVLEASDGSEGIEKARERVPDLILSDVMMPKKDGYELCRTLKNDERTSHIPIILLTAKAATESKLEGLETGADDYLIKPFEPKELQVRVKNLIELRRKLRERFKTSVPLKPGEIAVTSMDDAFLKKVMAAVEQQMDREHFHTDELAREVGLSRVQLHRKLVALTNQSPGEFVRYLRLHRAMQLLEKDAGTVSEIAYAVGFSDPSYFSKCFHKQFGKLPTDIKPRLS